MYKTQGETRAFFFSFLPLVAESKHCEIVIAPPYTSLSIAVEETKSSAVKIAAQNVHGVPEGAFTGEISARMLVDVGCFGVIIGHSERRQYFSETDQAVNRKVKEALANSLMPIVCVGETLEQRESQQMEQVLRRQFEGGLASLTPDEFSRILIAYEPVWAIGTGRTSTPENAAAAHAFLRELAATHFSSELAEGLRILYGGSVKPDNIAGLMAQQEIDGALVGGASLDPASFASIVNYPASSARK
jgi:triosephosphate isomerase (TIM)